MNYQRTTKHVFCSSTYAQNDQNDDHDNIRFVRQGFFKTFYEINLLTESDIIIEITIFELDILFIDFYFAFCNRLELLLNSIVVHGLFTIVGWVVYNCWLDCLQF